MAAELELKAVVPDPAELRARLLAAGAVAGFRGRMSDRRFDRAGRLRRRGQVLRVRSFHHPDGRVGAVLGWKGRSRRSPQGYKQREELEIELAGGAPPEALLQALGYRVIHAVDRLVETYSLGGATLRLEEYPRMDRLLEVEGSPPAIERAAAATGIPRAEFSADPLSAFVRRYERRGGRAALALESLEGALPVWARG